MRLCSRAMLRRQARWLRNLSKKHISSRVPWLHDLFFFHGRRILASMFSLLSARRITDLKSILSSTASTTRLPLVSVIVPCYNHALFLEARLNSILQQSYRQIELVLLDDNSNDGSAEILENFSRSCSLECTLVLNKHNSGHVFSQWQRGLELARGELIWIAESDDHCEPNFLETIVPLFQERGVLLAFSNTMFTDADGTRPVWSLSQYLDALPASTWRKPFTLSCNLLVELIWSRRNIIPNVSSCVFRAANSYPLLSEPRWLNMRVCGDWLWYLQHARGGLISYSPKTVNYYRQHSKNTSISQHGQEHFFHEHLSICEWILENFRLSQGACSLMQKELYQRWALQHVGPMSITCRKRIASLQPQNAGYTRKPNLLMVTYSLVAGGGEVFPLQLANSLYARGYAVTVLSCDQLPPEPAITEILHPQIPLLTLRSFQHLSRLIKELGIELVHSHNAWVDINVSDALHPYEHVRHVITSHGMYDGFDRAHLRQIGRQLIPNLAGAVFVANKNRAALLSMGLTADELTAIPNAAPQQPFEPVSRTKLGIADNAFVVSLVSRAIKEKGWSVAIDAVALARQRTNADIQLLLVGDGPEAEKLRKQYAHLDFVKFLGVQRDSRPFYACADLGLLPSWFSGESQPLTVIECLQVGRPFIASDIGDITAMLTGPDGLAGTVVPLRDGVANSADFAAAIETYQSDPELLKRHRERCPATAARFNWDIMLDAYAYFYEQALKTPRRRYHQSDQPHLRK